MFGWFFCFHSLILWLVCYTHIFHRKWITQSQSVNKFRPCTSCFKYCHFFHLFIQAKRQSEEPILFVELVMINDNSQVLSKVTKVFSSCTGHCCWIYIGYCMCPRLSTHLHVSECQWQDDDLTSPSNLIPTWQHLVLILVSTKLEVHILQIYMTPNDCPIYICSITLHSIMMTLGHTRINSIM